MKIDLTKIEGYETMSAEDKLKALEDYDFDTKGFVIDTEEFDPETLIGKKFVGEIRRCPAKINVETGVKEESKYFEIVKFYSEAEYERKNSRE